MGREIGQKCVRNMLKFLFLAFFSVVASSPNLSTFSFRVQSYEKSRAEQNKIIYFLCRDVVSSGQQSQSFNKKVKSEGCD